MGTVVTVMNMKGGVGKTTVTMHLGGIFGRYGIGGRRRKVLLIDYDPQFNLSQAFIRSRTYFQLEKQHKTSLSILLDDETALDPFKIQVPGNDQPPKIGEIVHSVYQSRSGEIDIVPSTMDLMYVALGWSNRRTRAIEERFRRFITECREKYDLILIDCHPAGSVLTKTSLQNCDHVLIPVFPEPFAVRGVGLMREFIGAVHAGGSKPEAHILFNRTPRTGKAPEELEIRKLPKLTNMCMDATLKTYRAFSEPFEGDGFVWTSRKPWSTKAFSNLLEVANEFAIQIGVKKP